MPVALAATCGSEWPAELLEDDGYEPHLAHPLRTKAIAPARVKTDAVDARTLAHPLRPVFCRRPGSPRASCATCAIRCATASRLRQRRDTLLRLIADFDREIDALAREIDRRATHDPRGRARCCAGLPNWTAAAAANGWMTADA